MRSYVVTAGLFRAVNPYKSVIVLFTSNYLRSVIPLVHILADSSGIYPVREHNSGMAVSFSLQPV